MKKHFTWEKAPLIVGLVLLFGVIFSKIAFAEIAAPSLSQSKARLSPATYGIEGKIPNMAIDRYHLRGISQNGVSGQELELSGAELWGFYKGLTYETRSNGDSATKAYGLYTEEDFFGWSFAHEAHTIGGVAGYTNSMGMAWKINDVFYFGLLGEQEGSSASRYGIGAALRLEEGLKWEFDFISATDALGVQSAETLHTLEVQFSRIILGYQSGFGLDQANTAGESTTKTYLAWEPESKGFSLLAGSYSEAQSGESGVEFAGSWTF